MGMLTRGKTLSRGRIYICHGPDEEDDELMMYANLKALYSSLASPFLTQPNQDYLPPVKIQGYFRWKDA